VFSRHPPAPNAVKLRADAPARLKTDIAPCPSGRGNYSPSPSERGPGGEVGRGVFVQRDVKQ